MNQKGKLIYCFDTELKAKLEQQGFKPIHVTKIDNKQVWVFNKTIPLLNFLHFNEQSKLKYAIGNRLNFVI